MFYVISIKVCSHLVLKVSSSIRKDICTSVYDYSMVFINHMMFHWSVLALLRDVTLLPLQLGHALSSTSNTSINNFRPEPCLTVLSFTTRTYDLAC